MTSQDSRSRRSHWQGRLRPLAPSALGLFVLLNASMAWAESAAITLKSGEVLNVEVIKLDFGKQVSVKLHDGTLKTLPWNEIEDLQMDNVGEAGTPEAGAAEGQVEGGAPAEPVEAQPAPVAAAPVAAAPVAATPVAAAPPAAAPAPDQSKRVAQILILESEIRDHKDNRPNVGGPLTLGIVGTAVGALFVVAAANGSSNCSQCDFTPTYAFGGANLVIGALGFVWLGAQVSARGKHREELNDLEAERDRLKVSVSADPNGAAGALTFNF